MRTQAFISLLGLLIVTAVPVFGSGDLPPTARDSEAFHYLHFEAEIAIQLVPTEIAVLAPRLHPEELSRALEDVGLTGATAAAEPIPGWARVTHTTKASVREILALALTLDSIEFASPVFELDGLPRYVTPWILTGPAVGVGEARFFELIGEHLAAELETPHWGGFEKIHRLRHASRDGLAVLEDANRFGRLPSVEHCAPDWLSRGRKHLVPNDSLFIEQWGLRNIGQGVGWVFDQDIDASEAWDLTTGDASVVIVVFDDGVQTAHPDLNLIAGQDFTGSGTGGQPGNVCDNHGTAVAGCVTAKINNSIGVAGVAPDCRVRSAKIGISDLGSPCPSTFSMADSWLVSAIGWAQTIGDVSNSSIGVGPAASISSAYNVARSNGMIHFGSSGNSAASSVGYPASLSSVNAVGALLPNGNRAGFSNTGAGLAFSAPGSEIATTDRTGSDGYSGGSYSLFFGGTSAASPYAAGVAALALSIDDTLTPFELEGLMQQSCVDKGASGYDTEYGWGFVNARNLLESLDPMFGPPSLTSISPSAGPTAGGNTVTLFGDELSPDAIVLFGTTLATLSNWVSPQQIEVIAPPGSPGDVNILLSQDSGSTSLIDAYLYSSNQLRIQSIQAPIGGVGVPCAALATNDVALAGISFAVEFEGSFIDVSNVTNVGTVTETAEFFDSDWANVATAGGSWWIAGLVMSFNQSSSLPPGTEVPILIAEYDIEPFAPDGTLVTLEIVDGGGMPPTDLVFSPNSGVAITPDALSGLMTIAEGGFVRGDANGDETVDVGDSISILAFLFSGGPGICADAMDANDDGAVDIGDAIFVLSFLFSGGPNPPAPYPLPGSDLTPDALGCG